MKKITFMLCLMLPLAGFSQATCATAVSVTAGNTVVPALDGTELPSPDCSLDDANPITTARWYSYTATVDGYATIAVDIAANPIATTDTRVHLYTGACGSLTCHGFNDDVDVDNNDYRSHLNFQVTAGTTYLFAFDDFWSGDGFTFALSESAFDCTTSIPYATSFDDPIAFLSCDRVADVDGNIISFIQQNLDLDGDGTDETFATSGSNGDVAKDDWLFSPSFDLTAGTNYVITYTFNGADAGNPANENLEALMVNSPDPAATFQQSVGSNTGIVQTGAFEELLTSATTVTGYFNPPTSGNYNLALHVTSPANSGFLLIFGETLDVSLAAPQFQNSNMKMYPNPVVNDLNVSNTNVIDAVEVYNLLGQKVLAQNFTANDVRVNLSQLTSGAYMVKVISGTETQTMKVIKQ